MKATGIVRRIDELGRVVIPKEIRKTYRLQEGDPIEIYTNNDDELILKKYSPIKDISQFADAYTESLNVTLHQTAIICDTDKVVSVAGENKKDYQDRVLSQELKNSLYQRQNLLRGKADALPVKLDDPMGYGSQVIVPILSGGDAFGAIILLSHDKSVSFSNAELNLAVTAAHFIAGQID